MFPTLIISYDFILSIFSTKDSAPNLVLYLERSPLESKLCSPRHSSVSRTEADRKHPPQGNPWGSVAL